MFDVAYKAGEQLRSFGLPASSFSKQERHCEEYALHYWLRLPIVGTKTPKEFNQIYDNHSSKCLIVTPHQRFYWSCYIIWFLFLAVPIQLAKLFTFPNIFPFTKQLRYMTASHSENRGTVIIYLNAFFFYKQDDNQEIAIIIKDFQVSKKFWNFHVLACIAFVLFNQLNFL